MQSKVVGKMSEEVSKTALEKGITDIFSSILAEEDRKAREVLAQHEDDPEVLKAAEALRVLDYRKFQLSLLRRQQQVSKSLIEKVLGKNAHLSFLMINQDYVGMHLRNLFVDIEGSSCCADKERTVMRALIRHYHQGGRIEFNYEGEYTYHLPQIVLRDHESIIGYFDGLYRLYYGDPKPYMLQMLKIAQIAQEARTSAEDT